MITNEENKTFADYLDAMKRRYPAIVLTFVAIFLPGVYATYSIDPMYRSTATILVQQQSISQDFAQTTVTGYTDEQIQETRQRVMSSTNLQSLVDKHGLYPDADPNGVSATELLEANTSFEPYIAEVVNERTGRTMLATISFDVSFDYPDAVTAQAVAADLAELYLRENVNNRLGQVRANIEFLESDIERLQSNVEKTSQQIAEFRQRNAGNLPEQANYNVRIIERNERSIDQLEENIRRARDRKLQLEAEALRIDPVATVFDERGEPIRGTAEQLAELQRERLRLLSLYSPEHPDVVNINIQIAALSGGQGTTYVGDIESQLEATRAELYAAKQRYSDDHPDVIKLSRSVAGLEAQLANAGAEGRPYRAEASSDPSVQKLNEQIRAIESDIATFGQQREQLMTEIADMELKLAQLPVIEQQFAKLTRYHDLAVGRYNDALRKLDEAKVAERLETRGSGERLSLGSQPRVPSNPYKPNRTALLMLVIVLGAGLGIILATVLDTLDDTIKSARDLLLTGDAPALAVIPFLETAGDRRSRYSKNLSLSALVAFAFVAAIMMSVTMG